jgi:cytochrome c553
MNRRLVVTSGLVLLLPLLGHAQASGNPEAGKDKAAKVCAQCHGPEGMGNATFPRLAGQYSDYLAKVLKDYKTGRRENALMKGFAVSLSDQDIEDLAAYYGDLR